MNYVLITPARNEEENLDRLIRSVASQTCLPLRWVIVSDGSTDGTNGIVESYSERYQWLDLLVLPDERDRSFAAKVGAFNAGMELLTDDDYDVIGCMDADVSFGPNYFEYLLPKFESNPKLGVAGTHYTEGDFHSFNDSFMNEEHVSGGCQLFRRDCFEQIGGYVANKAGGIDWIAVTTARMMGWETRSFGGETFEHHRKIGTAETSVLGSRLHYGRKDYFLGGHPLWQLFRGMYQMKKKPYVVGGACLWFGYVWAWIRGEEKAVSPELMKFYRAEQMDRLKARLSPGAGLHEDAR